MGATRKEILKKNPTNPKSKNPKPRKNTVNFKPPGNSGAGGKIFTNPKNRPSGLDIPKFHVTVV